jgi:hypothetical protein
MLLLAPFLFVTFVMLLAVVPLVLAVVSLVEIGRAPDPAFGPPWDNCKNAWTIGVAVSFVVPLGTLVASIIWWTQGRPALRRGQRVPRPFWAPKPAAPYPYMEGRPPAQPTPYEQPPQG